MKWLSVGRVMKNLSALGNVIAHMGRCILHVRWPSKHVENNLLVFSYGATEVLGVCNCVCSRLTTSVNSFRLVVQNTHSAWKTSSSNTCGSSHSRAHSHLRADTSCLHWTLIICDWLSSAGEGGAEWLIGRPCAPRSCERRERYKSDRCQNSQQGAVIEALKNETHEDGEESEKDNMEGRGKGKEITWLLERTPFKFWFFDTFMNMTVGTMGRISQLLLSKFIKTL